MLSKDVFLIEESHLRASLYCGVPVCWQWVINDNRSRLHSLLVRCLTNEPQAGRMGQLRVDKRPLAWNETLAEGTKRNPRQSLRVIYIKHMLIIDRKKKHNGEKKTVVLCPPHSIISLIIFLWKCLQASLINVCYWSISIEVFTLCIGTRREGVCAL